MHSLGFSIILEEHQQVSKSRGPEHIHPLQLPMTHQTFDIKSFLRCDLDQQGQECWTPLQGNLMFAIYRSEIHKKLHQLQYSVELHQSLVSVEYHSIGQQLSLPYFQSHFVHHRLIVAYHICHSKDSNLSAHVRDSK
jgi:hypothetical protein